MCETQSLVRLIVLYQSCFSRIDSYDSPTFRTSTSIVIIFLEHIPDAPDSRRFDDVIERIGIILRMHPSHQRAAVLKKSLVSI